MERVVERERENPIKLVEDGKNIDEQKHMVTRPQMTRENVSDVKTFFCVCVSFFPMSLTNLRSSLRPHSGYNMTLRDDGSREGSGRCNRRTC